MPKPWQSLTWSAGRSGFADAPPRLRPTGHPGCRAIVDKGNKTVNLGVPQQNFTSALADQDAAAFALCRYCAAGTGLVGFSVWVLLKKTCHNPPRGFSSFVTS